MNEVSLTRTVEVPISVTCPSWCEVPTNEHIRDLWDMEGNCIHHSPCVYIVDRVGFHASLEPERFADGVELNFTTQTDLNGRESAPPVVHMYGNVQEMTMSQALSLSTELLGLVETYRANGGVA